MNLLRIPPRGSSNLNDYTIWSLDVQHPCAPSAVQRIRSSPMPATDKMSGRQHTWQTPPDRASAHFSIPGIMSDTLA
jgi:hypothetical protein